MPQFPWQKSFNRSSTRPSHSSSFYVEGQQQHPDLPLPTSRNISRSTSVTERHGHYLENRRSIALFPSPNSSPAYHPETSSVSSPDTTTTHDRFSPPRSPAPGGGISRSQTVVYRDNSYRNHDIEPIYETAPHWEPENQRQQQLPTPQEELYHEEELASMSNNNTVPGKTSSDSGSATGLDRWSQRRLQRLNTEQGFREQRQGGGGQSGGSVLSPLPGADHSFPPSSASQQNNSNYTQQQQHESAQPQSLHQQQSQPQLSYPATRSGSNAGLTLQQQQQQQQSNNNTHSRSPNNYSHDPSTLQQQQQHQQQQQYSPPDALTQYQANRESRNQQTRSYQSGTTTTAANAAAANNNNNNILDSESMSSLANSNGNAAAAAAKAARSGIINRQSVHTDLLSRETSGVSSQQNTQSNQAADPRRPTPQPLPTSQDMSEDDIDQLIKDHKELREKYTKVKKYYFEKEDQVKQLQNSLAHQRLSQSRTSLDDSEYTTRFNRLDGLIAQLAFSIRKSWRSLPSWLANSVNKDAVTTGKQEMTAAGRAFISCWLVEEVFDKYFHPDLEPALSAQLKSIQRNIRRFATPAQTTEEDDYLISKVVNWRLATLEGLQDALRSPQCPTFRAQMTDMLKEHLCGALAVHLQEPPPSDLEGGVHMIVELVVSIAIHLPLESRDVVIEYFMPGYSISPDQMKFESGIPALTVSIADDAADRASMKSASSEIDNDSMHEQPSKKRGMLSALTGSGNKTRNTSSQKGAGASSSSLHRPESSAGKDEPPRVRMAAGIGVSVRGRSVLVKAPVFST